MAYLLMLVSKTLTMMQGHSGSADSKHSPLNYLDNKARNNDNDDDGKDYAYLNGNDADFDDDNDDDDDDDDADNDDN